MIAAAVITLSGRDDDKTPTANSTSSTVDAYSVPSRPATTAVDAITTLPDPNLPAVTPGPNGRGVRIDDIKVFQGTYQVFYRTTGYEPRIADDPASHHMHFFFDDVTPENAGSNGPMPGRYVLWDVPSPFTGYRIADRPAAAQRICVLVADRHHGVEQGSGNCVPLPVS